MRRAARSVPAVIAEGYGRRSTPREFCRYLSYGVGEANEMEVHITIARRLEYVTEEETESYLNEYRTIGKQLTSLIKYWQSRDAFDGHQIPDSTYRRTR